MKLYSDVSDELRGKKTRKRDWLHGQVMKKSYACTFIKEYQSKETNLNNLETLKSPHCWSFCRLSSGSRTRRSSDPSREVYDLFRLFAFFLSALASLFAFLIALMAVLMPKHCFDSVESSTLTMCERI